MPIERILPDEDDLVGVRGVLLASGAVVSIVVVKHSMRQKVAVV